ncbi:USO1-like protein [Sesbania bispinosa]|nr:USO1-like protein [Sesbania bispinosa]
MARTRKTYRLVDPGSSSHPNLQGGEDAEERKAWIDIKALEAHSLVSEDDAIAYFASLPETPCYDLIKPTMNERVSDHPRRDSEEDWFYIYDYCLTTLGVDWEFLTSTDGGRGNITSNPLVGDEVIALIDSMAEGSRMAAMRRAFLVQLGQTSTPQPLNHPRKLRDLSDRQSRKGILGLYLTQQEMMATTHLLKAASSVRHMENYYLPLLKRSEEDRKEALAKVKVLSEQNQKLSEENKKLSNTANSLVEDLKKVNESLTVERHSKDLAIRDRDEIKEKYEVTLTQVKGAEDQYLEAKEENDKMLKDLQSARTGLENTLKELEEAKKSKIDLEAKIIVSETTNSELEELREKYNDVLLNLGKNVYENTIQQLMILNPGLVIHGSTPHAYVDNGIIMVDTLQGPIPLVPKIDDHQEAKHSGTDQQPQPQDGEVESKNRAINLD